MSPNPPDEYDLLVCEPKMPSNTLHKCHVQWLATILTVPCQLHSAREQAGFGNGGPEVTGALI